jgi:peptidoglycan/LPS O-acetylase OafA/YrhL
MPELDGLRFIAFLLVFLHHLPFPSEWTSENPVLARIHAFGWIGVDIFLVLSAYLLTTLALREIKYAGKLDIRKFYKRRIIRIWPLYFLALSIGFFVYPGLLAAAGAEVTVWPTVRDHLIPFALFFGNFSYAHFRETLGLFRSLWTISLEEQFYLLLPLVVLLLWETTRIGWQLAVAAVLAISLLSRIYFQQAGVEYPWIWVSLITRLDPLALGVALAFVESRHGSIRINKATAGLAAVGLFLLISSFPQLGQSDHTIWQLLLSATASAALLIAASEPHVAAVLSARPFVALGKVTYGLYVYHRYSIDIFMRATEHFGVDASRPVEWLVLAGTCFLLTAFVALASYKWFESYFLLKKSSLEVVPSRPV